MRKFTKLQANSYVLVACIVAIFAVLIGCPMPGPGDTPGNQMPPPTPPDTTAPTPATTPPEGFQVPAGSTFLPAQNADSIDPSSNSLTIAFNEAIRAVASATARISLAVVPPSSSDVSGTSDATGEQSSPQQTFDVNNDSQVRIAGMGLTLLEVTLAPDTDYSITIPTGVITDGANNPVVQTIEFGTEDTPDPPAGEAPALAEDPFTVAFDTGITIITANFDKDIGIANANGFDIELTGGTSVVTLPNVTRILLEVGSSTTVPATDTTDLIILVEGSLANGTYTLSIDPMSIQDTESTPNINTSEIRADFTIDGPRFISGQSVFDNENTVFIFNFDADIALAENLPDSAITLLMGSNPVLRTPGQTLMGNPAITASVGGTYPNTDATDLILTVADKIGDGAYTLTVAPGAILDTAATPVENLRITASFNRSTGPFTNNEDLEIAFESDTTVITVEFNEPIDLIDPQPTNAFAISTSNDNMPVTGITITPSEESPNADNTRLVLTVNTALENNDYALTIAQSVIVDTSEDPVANNAIIENFTLGGPRLTDIATNVSGGNTVITVEFRDDIAIVTADDIDILMGTDASAMQLAGNPTITPAVGTGADTDTLIITVEAVLLAGDYTLSIAEGAITDTEIPANGNDEITEAFTITARPDGAPEIANQAPVSVAQGATITDITFMSTDGTIISCAHDGLPTGLRATPNVAGEACVIHGTVANSVPPGDYTVRITAINGTGQDSAEVVITVTAAPVAAPNFDSTAGVYSVSEPIQPNVVVNEAIPNLGGAITMCRVSAGSTDSLPDYLTVTPVGGTCVISGTAPNMLTFANIQVTIEGSNAGGSDTVIVDILILDS